MRVIYVHIMQIVLPDFFPSNSRLFPDYVIKKTGSGAHARVYRCNMADRNLSDCVVVLGQNLLFERYGFL